MNNFSVGPEDLTPDWSLHPGVMVRSVLELRSIRQAELAERTGMTPKHVSQIVRELIGISGDTAVLLERALGIPARYWTRLDADYAAYQGQRRARNRLPEFRSWADGFDSAQLQRCGVILPGDSEEMKVEKLLRFFGVANPEAFERTWLQPRVSFRRSQSFTVGEQNTALWLRLVERQAQLSETGPLDIRALRKISRSLPGFTSLPIADGFAAARSALASAGVVLVFVRQVPRTRVCGATWWLAGNRPVIGVTERHRKPDSLWFSIAHEVGHLVLHPRRVTFLDLESEQKAHVDDAETEAHDFAERTLLPDGANQLIARATTRAELALLAAQFRVGASIIAGRHGKLTGNWPVGAKLRGLITDQDIEVMESCT